MAKKKQQATDRVRKALRAAQEEAVSEARKAARCERAAAEIRRILKENDLDIEIFWKIVAK